MSLLNKIVNVDYKKHLLISLIIRFVLIIYGTYHDQLSEVKYTDVDYNVFTDAARHIVIGGSPYDRHTYRYSPIVAIFLIPNVVWHHSFGKILFSFVDIIVALLIRLIVQNCLKEYRGVVSNKLSAKNRRKLRQDNDNSNTDDWEMNVAMMAWLYNPLTIAIGTRGNCDSLAVFFVLLTLYLLQCKRYNFVSGLVHGVSIHFRLYPVIYSLSLFMYLSKYSVYTTEDRREKKSIKAIEESVIGNAIIQSSSAGGHNVVPYSASTKKTKTIFKAEYLLYLLPNLEQLKLILGCVLSLVCLTCYFYKLYGDKFLYETYVYHLIRKDTRHNFSLYFYLQYLTAWVKNIGMWQKALMILPQLVLILVFSVRYGLNRCTLNFAILVKTIVMVVYNAVLTSQYFVWVMAVMPLCLWQIKMGRKDAAFLLLIWFLAQSVWLLPAYLLEFHGQNTFLFIWIQSVSFFCSNITILGRLIMYFMPVKAKSN